MIAHIIQLPQPAQYRLVTATCACCGFPFSRSRNESCKPLLPASNIQENGIAVDRKWMTVPGFARNVARICQNSVNDENYKMAARFLGFAHGT